MRNTHTHVSAQCAHVSTTILAVFVLTTTDGGTALVVSLLTVSLRSLLSGYVLWGMSDDENQLLGSLENEDPSNSES